MSQPDHYFSAEPASTGERRDLRVELAGRTFTVQTAPGIFCPDRIDLGTSVLLREAPAPPPTGQLLDLGSGWGPLALTLGLRSRAATVWAVDVNRRALGLVRHNAELLAIQDLRAVEPQDVPSDVTFDLIWSNPPIRVGKAALHDLMRTWLPRLAPGGTAYLVVQRNLGSDSLHRWLADPDPDRGLGATFKVERHASAKGFRVLKVSAPA